VELLLGLALAALSRVLSVGDEYSLGRAAVLVLACGLVVAYGLVRNPYAPFYCWAFVTPIFPAFGSGMALIFGGILAVYLNRQNIEWDWQFSRAGIAFCAWTYSSLAWAGRVYLAQDSFIANALPAMILAFAIAGISDRSFRRNMLLLVAGACVLGSAVTLRNWTTGRLMLGIGRTWATLNPNIFSAWLLVGLMGALAWLVAGRPATWLRFILLASLPAIVLGIGLCGYRAAILGAGLGVMVVGVCQRRFFRGVLMVLFLAASALALYVAQPAIFDPVLSRFQTINEDRGSERLDIWEGALRMFEESPWLGVGSDNFKFGVKRYYGEEILSHSIYVATLVELGVVGFALLLWWIYTLLKKTWRSEDRVWVFPLLVVQLFQAAFLHQFYFSCFWLVLGLAEGALPARARGVSGQPQPSRQRLARQTPSPRPRIGMRRMVPVRLVEAGARLVRSSVRPRVGGGRQ
jgi:hypothetical protein